MTLSLRMSTMLAMVTRARHVPTGQSQQAGTRSRSSIAGTGALH